MWYHQVMGKYEKLLEKMRQNPRDWRIDELKKIADRLEVDYRQPGTSHVTFRSHNGNKLTVPARKPIKPIYIKQFIDLVDEEK
jgi:hypothetical protein